MSVPKYRLDAIETIGRKILQEYDPALLDGPPQAVPIETIIETKFDLTLEYHCLRKNGSILGETIFDEGAAILYDQDEKRYRLIAVKAGTILVEERLCVDRLLGRLRFTCAHELGHWVLHQKLYSGTGDVAAYEGKTSLDESHGLVEWQADALATIEGALINKHTVDFALDFLRKEKKTCNFNDFKKYWYSLQKTDQINVLRIVFNGKSDLLKTWKELSKGIAADKKLILEKAMIGGKTSGWVSDYLDTFFQSVFQIEGAFSEKAFRKYLENEDHLKSTLREFENNFPELYSLIERLCDIICE